MTAQQELRTLAGIGARTRIVQLRREEQRLVALFPELRETKADHADIVLTRRAKPGRKHPMSAAERKAVSQRMRKYWAAQRALKAKGKKSRIQ